MPRYADISAIYQGDVRVASLSRRSAHIKLIANQERKGREEFEGKEGRREREREKERERERGTGTYCR